MAGGYSLGGALSRSTFVSIDGTSQPVELLVRIQRGAAITLGAQLEGSSVPAFAADRCGRVRDCRRRETCPSARNLTSDRRGDLYAAGRGGIPRSPPGSSASDRGCRACRVAPRVAHHDTDKAPALRLPAEQAGSLGFPSSRVASIGAPRAVDDERRRARLRRPARCRSTARRARRVPRSRPRGRRGPRPHRRHGRIHAGAQRRTAHTRITRRRPGGTREPGNTEYIRIVARAGLEPVQIEIDADGIRTHALEGSGADIVVVSPAHQHRPVSCCPASGERSCSDGCATETPLPSRTTTTPSTATSGPRRSAPRPCA